MDHPLRFTVEAGLFNYHGLLVVEETGLRIEYQRTLGGYFPGRSHTLTIPWPEIASVVCHSPSLALAGLGYGPAVVVQTRTLASVDTIPWMRSGRIKVATARCDEYLADCLAALATERITGQAEAAFSGSPFPDIKGGTSAGPAGWVD